MNIKHYPELQEIEEHNNYLPSISVILPLPVAPGEDHAFKKLIKAKADELESKLNLNYGPEIVRPLIEKYHQQVDELLLDKSKSGVVIYLSSWFHKTYYLDFIPSEKMIIDDSFEIRDLIFNHDVVQEVILFLMSANEIRLALYKNQRFTKIHVDVPLRIEAFMQNTLHDVAVYYEKSDRKEKAMQLFIKNAEEALAMALKVHPLPVIIVGGDKMIHQFEHQTQLGHSIIAYKHGNYFEEGPSELKALVTAGLEENRSKKILVLKESLIEANNRGLLAIGLNEVWKQLVQNNIKTLVVEQNYRKPAILGPDKMEIITHHLDSSTLPLQDVVDDIIEKVITHGGKIEFVPDGTLTDYRRIAMIKNYV